MSSIPESFASRDEILSTFSFDLSHELLTAAKVGPVERSRIEAKFLAHAADGHFLDEPAFVELMASLGVSAAKAALYFAGFNTASPRGRVDYHQFEVGIIAMDPHTPHGGAWGAERLTYIFSLYDTDGDGTISGSEFAAMLADIATARARGTRPPQAESEADAALAWATVFGFDSLAAGSLDFRAFHTAVGEMRIRGTSKLFRLRGSFIHGSSSAAAAAQLRPGATPAKSQLALPPVSPMMSPFSSPARAAAPKAKATLYWKAMTPARQAHYADARSRREAHAAYMSEAFGSAARKKVNFLDPDVISAARSPTKAQDGVTSKVINPLLLGSETWSPPPAGEPFDLLTVPEFLRLAQRAGDVLASEPTLVEAKAPFKVFGDIHGQINDLLAFFRTYGAPQHVTGDIELVSYMFLGDFVDRGPHSLEVVALLFSLKVRYPSQIILIRGNHEDAAINADYGFKAECLTRLGNHDGAAVWAAVNDAFTHLPLAGLIDSEIFCCHGGLGGSVHGLDDVRAVPKPVVMSQLAGTRHEHIVRDLLWSDPTASDSVVGVHANSRGPDVTTYGPDRVQHFCIDNDVSMIIRAHECVQDGFELFSAGHLVSLFTATNYQGKYENDGAYLEITRNLKVTPKVIKAKKLAPARPASAPQHSKVVIPIQHHELAAQRSDRSRPSSAAAARPAPPAIRFTSDYKENHGLAPMVPKHHRAAARPTFTGSGHSEPSSPTARKIRSRRALRAPPPSAAALHAHTTSSSTSARPVASSRQPRRERPSLRHGRARPSSTSSASTRSMR
ncbi:serine/threonine protein phosphatase [Thecamonas trahens ATCC 50062]|uniref:Serine/threonine-protein phosphatase n=1 Tax=Thecamonas trahens ATCC 50062 TaxID=461836 RepID=A0A0L0DA61_THETB|nr:serine/threonine protein phosphatase [Thecamonas trahens ATCC 50062]KNC48981.1 serine/threonine protein phosphatase [Thecamonas trahens ATCC 50062]|eukprot:XP_013758396.1 serine/threonine protein phosphatase [Thecamonas trahens ATCC 50062]